MRVLFDTSALLDTLDEQLHEWQIIGLTPSVLQRTAKS